MKKTFNINVAGFPFVIDEDAYILLNDYLKTIEHAFRHVDGSSELISDIESRIAELLLECSGEGSPIITLADVEKVIARVGKPEEFVEDETITIESQDGNTETVNVESERTTPPPYIPPLPHPAKRLYRDPQNAMLGGVCSGLAWYLGWDVTWIRLIVVILTIFSYATVGLIYILLWIVVPEARTPLQRMQMMGEQPTMENIGKTVTDNFREEQGVHTNPQPSNAPTAANFLAKSMGIMAKAVVIIGLIFGIPILLALALGLLGCVLFMIAWGTSFVFGHGMPFDYPEFNGQFVSKIVFWGVLCGIGWILTLGVPLFYAVRRGLGASPLKTQSKRIINVIWGIGFILAGMATGMVITAAYQQEKYYDERWRHDHSETEEVEAIISEEEIDSSEITVIDSDSTLTKSSDSVEITDSTTRIP